MDDRAALFANVLNDPADDTARLVLADWFEEHDLGQLPRAGVTGARFRGEPLIGDPDYFDAFGTGARSSVTRVGRVRGRGREWSNVESSGRVADGE